MLLEDRNLNKKRARRRGNENGEHNIEEDILQIQ